MKGLLKNKSFGGACTLGLGALVAKLLGAVYRIPLTNLIGAYGLGLYQMVFPVYTLLLDFSGAAVPSAISKIISSFNGQDKEIRANEYLISALKLLLIFGGVCSIFMAVFSLPISSAQGDRSAKSAYLFLAPAIVFVSIICCFRGYFQGLMEMKPTAISQVIEQALKMLVGLVSVKLLMPNVIKAVAGATFAITFSEAVSALWLYIKYTKRKKKLNLKFPLSKDKSFLRTKTLIKTAIPITIIGIAMPLSHVIDSFLIVNLLSEYTKNATSLYGISSGSVHTIINLPVALCYGFATVAIPEISAKRSQREKAEVGKKAILTTLIVSLPFVLVCITFAPLIISLLFSGFDLEQTKTAINLLKISAPCITLLSVVQTQNAVLIGEGKLYRPVISLLIGVFVKTLVEFLLVQNPTFNIYGSAIAAIACYFVVCLVNLLMTYTKKVKNESSNSFSGEYAG